jgi:polyisoprenyl-phosphate glycosyltransferase
VFKEDKMTKLAVVIPCYNEEAIVETLLKRLTDALTGCVTGRHIDSYEIITVDDGSQDRTFAMLASAASKDKKIKLVSLSRNCGHQVAISAGLDYAQAEAVIVMDADLQDPPELIPEIVGVWKKGFKVVHMKRRARKGEGFFKKAAAKMFYRVLNAFSTVPIPPDTGDFKLLDKEVVLYLRRLKEHHRYLRGLTTLAGFNQTTLEYDRPPRFAGRPKYSFWKSLQLASDGVTSLSSRPLKMVTYLGVIGIIGSVVLAVYAVISKFLFSQTVLRGWTSLLIALTFFSGIQLFSLGLIGEYVGRIFEEVKNRPLYVVKETVNF